MPQSGYLLKFQSWTYTPIETGEQLFFGEAAPKRTTPGEAAETTGDEEVASREASLISNQAGQGSPTNRKELNLDIHQGTQLPLVNVCS